MSATSEMANHMAWENSITAFPNQMISSITMGNGKMDYPMATHRRIITMAMFIKGIFIMGKGKEQDHMCSIKSIDMRASGGIIPLLERVNCSKMANCSSKGSLKMASSMVMESINIKMETSSKETTLKIKSVEKADITSIKEESSNPNSTPAHPKYPEFN